MPGTVVTYLHHSNSTNSTTTDLKTYLDTRWAALECEQLDYMEIACCRRPYNTSRHCAASIDQGSDRDHDHDDAVRYEQRGTGRRNRMCNDDSFITFE